MHCQAFSNCIANNREIKLCVPKVVSAVSENYEIVANIAYNFLLHVFIYNLNVPNEYSVIIQ